MAEPEWTPARQEMYDELHAAGFGHAEAYDLAGSLVGPDEPRRCPKCRTADKPLDLRFCTACAAPRYGIVNVLDLEMAEDALALGDIAEALTCLRRAREFCDER